KRGKDKVVVQDLLRPAHLVPQSKSLAGLLSDFRRSKSHMALVMDEYGSLTGIVTLEDLIEEIVGEIDDEHDRPEQPMERISDNHVRVDGKFPIDELNDNLGLDLPTEDYHTIGGFVFGILGQQPHEGDVVRHDGIRFEVTETDGPRIVHVDVITHKPDAADNPGTGTSADGSQANGTFNTGSNSYDRDRDGKSPPFRASFDASSSADAPH
ncbi:MAG: CBS domain-containing protein, partial [Thermoleophilia bacterium]|nr:CBS domain-containing protein [Thermoleophilia bacterium]